MATDQYWAYVHENESGDLTEDLGNFDDLGDAIDELCSNLRYNNADYFRTHTGRVVDMHHQAGGTTIWIAGAGNQTVPVNSLEDLEVVEDDQAFTVRDALEQTL